MLSSFLCDTFNYFTPNLGLPLKNISLIRINFHIRYSKNNSFTIWNRFHLNLIYFPVLFKTNSMDHCLATLCFYLFYLYRTTLYYIDIQKMEHLLSSTLFWTWPQVIFTFFLSWKIFWARNATEVTTNWKQGLMSGFKTWQQLSVGLQ